MSRDFVVTVFWCLSWEGEEEGEGRRKRRGRMLRNNFSNNYSFLKCLYCNVYCV